MRLCMCVQSSIVFGMEGLNLNQFIGVLYRSSFSVCLPIHIFLAAPMGDKTHREKALNGSRIQSENGNAQFVRFFKLDWHRAALSLSLCLSRSTRSNRQAREIERERESLNNHKRSALYHRHSCNRARGYERESEVQIKSARNIAARDSDIFGKVNLRMTLILQLASDFLSFSLPLAAIFAPSSFVLIQALFPLSARAILAAQRMRANNKELKLSLFKYWTRIFYLQAGYFRSADVVNMQRAFGSSQCALAPKSYYESSICEFSTPSLQGKKDVTIETLICMRSSTELKRGELCLWRLFFCIIYFCKNRAFHSLLIILKLIYVYEKLKICKIEKCCAESAMIDCPS